MSETGVPIRDYLGDFVAKHLDMSESGMMLKVTSKEVELLGESLVKGVMSWALEPDGKRPPAYYVEVDDLPTGLSPFARKDDAKQEDLTVNFTTADVVALGEFFVMGILKWVQSIQIARGRYYRLMEAVLARQAEIAARQADEPEDDEYETLN